MPPRSRSRPGPRPARASRAASAQRPHLSPAREAGDWSFYMLPQVGFGKMVAQCGFAANRNGASDPYQGTTSVVPTIMAGIKGFSPMRFSFWGSANTT